MNQLFIESQFDRVTHEIKQCMKLANDSGKHVCLYELKNEYITYAMIQNYLRQFGRLKCEISSINPRDYYYGFYRNDQIKFRDEIDRYQMCVPPSLTINISW